MKIIAILIIGLLFFSMVASVTLAAPKNNVGTPKNNDTTNNNKINKCFENIARDYCLSNGKYFLEDKSKFFTFNFL